MPELTPERIAQGVTYYVVLLFSLSVHESSHGWTALRMGDDTALREGRISLNPLVHLDPVGTVLVPLLQFLWGGIPLMAWAKPTPVQARHFKPGQLARGHVLVAGAGPLSNLALAVLFTLALFVARRVTMSDATAEPVFWIIETGVLINVALAIFNLVPLPPLDGSWIASWGLPRPIADRYDRVMEPYGPWILLILFATGLLRLVTAPFILLLHGLLYSLV